MKKAKTKKSSNKAGSKNSKAKAGSKPSKQQQEINQALAAAAAAQASANSAQASANAANAENARLSSAAVASAAVYASQSTSVSNSLVSTAAINTQLSTALVSSAQAFASTTTAQSQALVAQANIDALNTVVAVAAGAAGGNGFVSIQGGESSSVAYAYNGVGSGFPFNATLQGDTLGAAVIRNASNVPFTINVSGVTTTKNWYLTGGSTQDTYIFSSGEQLRTSVITSGGTNTDTIMFSSAATTADSNFAGVTSGSYILSGTNGASNFVVGSNAQRAGVSTLVGGTGADIFNIASTYGTTGVSLYGGSGADTFAFANVTQLTNATVTAGTASDVITIDSGVVTNSAFVNKADVETFSFVSGTSNSFAYGTTTRDAGIRNINGAAGADTFTFGTAASFGALTLSISGGAGNDNFSVASGATVGGTFVGGANDDTFSFASNSGVSNRGNISLDGGTGTDVISFSQGVTIANSGFTNASNIEQVAFSAASSLTFGTSAQAAGIVSVSGSSAADTFVFEAGTTAITITGNAGNDSFSQSTGITTANTFVGGEGDDLFTFIEANQLSAVSLDGGAGSNSIAYAQGVTLTDANFSRIAAGTIQAITGGGTGGSNITVGSNALAAGIRQVTGSATDDILTVSGVTTTITLSGGGGNDTFNGGTSAENVYLFNSGTNLDDSTINGSTVTSDIIGFSVAATVDDDDFSGKSGINSLVFNGTAGSTLVFGGNAGASGITSVTNNASGALTITIASTEAVTFSGGAGADNFLASSTSVLLTASLVGGAGVDTLTLGAGVTAADSSFARISAGTIEVLGGTATSTLTVGSNALNAGIRSIYASTGGSVTIESSFGTTGFTAVGGTGVTNSNTFTFASASSFANATIQGGSANADTVVISAPGTFTSLANLSGIEVVSLTGESSLSFTTGGVTGANTLTIISGTGATSITATLRENNLVLSGTSGYSDTFSGGQGNDTLQGWSSTPSAVNDTLTGGVGNDVFVIATGYTGALSAGVVGYNGAFAVITDFGRGSDIISIGQGNSATSGTNGGSLFTIDQGLNSPVGYDFGIRLNSDNSYVAKGNFYSGYTAGVVLG